MDLQERIESFATLGNVLRNFNSETTSRLDEILYHAATEASQANPWFTLPHIGLALNNLGLALTEENLAQWLAPYHDRICSVAKCLTIGTVMAGNIPAVGFHDLLCILISGHRLHARLSSDDKLLIPAMAEVLTETNPGWKEMITFTEGFLTGFDAVIATGNNNTARYFEHYFGKYPHIIRKNRNSIAILGGRESDAELEALASDIMLYFGMGCRSVSALYVPAGYDFTRLMAGLEKYRDLINHHRYRNNYDYQKSILMVNRKPFIDNGFLLLVPAVSLASPIATLYYNEYEHPAEISTHMEFHAGSLQCIVSVVPLAGKITPPGQAQQPSLRDYADGVDTLDFLLSLT